MILNDPKDYAKFSLQSKLRAYIHNTMHQRNVQQTNKSFPPSRICIWGMVKMSHAELAKFSAIS